MSAPLPSVAVATRHLEGAQRELRILVHEEARIVACLEALRESAAKDAIRSALAGLRHLVASQRSAVNRRRLELEAAEAVGVLE